MGLIRRTFTCLDEETFLLLYKSLVRPNLEYANSIWSPYKIKDITAIENVQRRATKLIPSLKELEYEERLKKLKLPKLKYRRTRGDMIEAYKLTSGIYDKSLPNLLTYNTSSVTRGHNKKLAIQRCNKIIRSNFFTQRIAPIWNNLPNSVVNAPTIQTFESRLDKYWKDTDMKYDYRAKADSGTGTELSQQETEDLSIVE